MRRGKSLKSGNTRHYAVGYAKPPTASRFKPGQSGNAKGLDGKLDRLIVTLPPRHLKSIIFSVALPAFLLGLDPTKRIICVSYSNELAVKHANDFRAVLDSYWYQRIFPNTKVSRQKDTQTETMTASRGFRMATSLGGTITGRGAHLIILDDPQKPEEALSEPSVITQHNGLIPLCNRASTPNCMAPLCWLCNAFTKTIWSDVCSRKVAGTNLRLLRLPSRTNGFNWVLGDRIYERPTRL